MNEQETSTSPPDTLIGLGPPEPPEKYGEHPADAPETLRAWSTSRKIVLEEEAPSAEPFLPLESLFPGRIGPISDSDEVTAVARRFRRSPARSASLWAAPVLLTAIAIASSTAFSGVPREPAAASRAAPARPSTTRVVGGPWVLREDVSEESQDETAEPARIFYREPRAPKHRTTARPSAPPPPVEAPIPETEIARNHARVQEVADAVELEDEVPEPKQPDTVDPGASEAATP